MCIELERQNNLYILHLKGRFLTGSDEDCLRAWEELQKAGPRAVVADCRDLLYLDSTGLTFVVGVYKTLIPFAGRFGLANVNSRVREVLRITRLDELLPIFESVSVAVAALAPVGATAAA